ncbi:mycothiol-dependent nitroreductase Rv2466c family protein [Kribbia dieselivorans]|uniref:mycothiol-dependent nitroreductase Rv2466c family protein n=1 Tax=Kribbia dieselivorans TaxID=331526 RepID=UPI0008389AFF|nr:DsbA family protein [Kribbia dieselivorans]
MTTHIPVVDIWFDPVCPYSWITTRWLLEVRARRPIDLRWHVMSLALSHENDPDDDAHAHYLRQVGGVARVASAAAEQAGAEVLDGLYTAYGTRTFHTWGRPDPQECRAAMVEALAETGLPEHLIGAFDDPVDDPALRLSHQRAVSSVGAEAAGTPIIHLDGAAFFGPVLNSLPHGEEAVRIFEGVRLLAGFPDFFELKRTREHPPVVTAGGTS